MVLEGVARVSEHFALFNCPGGRAGPFAQRGIEVRTNDPLPWTVRNRLLNVRSRLSSTHTKAVGNCPRPQLKSSGKQA
jgi:hypothetical protein